MKIDRFLEMLSSWTTRPGALHHRLSAAIEHGIVQGFLLPGTRLPAERNLAQALSVSRTTVVSAYSSLHAKGWLESKTGSGTWVSRQKAIAARSLAHSCVVSRGSILSIVQSNDPNLLNLAIATTEPLAEFVQDASVRARDHVAYLLGQRAYLPFGLPALRIAIASYLTKTGTSTSPEQILITTGAQQAISLITALFVLRGDSVLVESPTYFGALEVFRFAGARLYPIQVEENHVSSDSLTRRIATVQPRLIYVSPSCQNPTGAILPTHDRRKIARCAEQHQVPIIEDESLADLTFRGDRLPSISAYSPSAPILTIGSLSKLISAGLRIGWIRGPLPLINRLARLKSASDLGSASVSQAIALEVFARIYEARAMRIPELRVKRDLVVDLLRRSQVDWEFTQPEGGLSIWLKMPGVEAQALSQLAMRRGLAIAPGNLFSADESHPEFLRLPFLLSPEMLATAVEGLVETWREVKRSPAIDAANAVMV